MNQFLGISGYIVVIGYLLKILFQMYSKYKRDEGLGIGAGNVIAWDYWKPIRMQEGSNLNWLRRLFNFIHVLALAYLLILFLYLIFFSKRQDS